METLILDAPIGSAAALPTAVNVHPVVLFSILDQHLRRSEGQDRVIGVLLGSTQGTSVEVTNSFGVFHVKREGEVLVRRTSVNDLLALHKRINDKEVVVGWYSTLSEGEPIDDFTLAVHDFFADFALKPIHLLVDVTLAQSRVGVQAYVATSNALVRNTLFTFQQLRVVMAASAEEMVGVDAMAKAAAGQAGQAHHVAEVADAASDLEALDTSMRRLKALLDTTLSFVDDVVSGKRAAPESSGRDIAETLAAVPQVDPVMFEKAFSSSLQDVLLVAYLANLTQAQMKLAEKIAQISQN